MSLKEKVDLSKLPKHIAIIMDGNGRWAQQQGQHRVFGHENGVRSVKETAEAAAELGIEYVTLYAFSTENWNRPQYEVDALMQLLVATINSEVKTLNENNIRLLAIGDLKNLPENCYEELTNAMVQTSKNTRMNLVLALNYSSRWEILNAVKHLAEKIEKKEMKASEVNENIFESQLSTKGIPDPELMIRTSGEQRISNFLLWQLSYAESVSYTHLTLPTNREV